MPNVQLFEKSCELPASAAEAFAWHARPGALDRLIPPWENVTVQDRGHGIANGSRVILVNRLGGIPLTWVAEHCDYQEGRQFRDIQRSGPFRHWDHTHRFVPVDDHRCTLEDHIEYVVPGGFFGLALGGRFVRSKIERMFEYRHVTTLQDLRTHQQHRDRGPLHVAVTGSSGLLGRVLVPLLTTGGHRVTRVVRGVPGEGEVAWDPLADSFDASGLEGVDAVVHLAGENIAAGRWNESRKRRIRDSRVRGTETLCKGLAQLSSPPGAFVSASAVGYYGDRAAATLDENSSAGSGFLADVVQAWEAATAPAAAAGIRIACARLGMILSPRGGALAKMLPPFQFGAGGRVGSGEQYWSWIELNDAAAALLHVIMTDSLTGPVNIVTPQPVTNANFTAVLAHVLSRPGILPVPSSAARLAFGEMADELLLASTRVLPGKLVASGYQFRHATLDAALRYMLGSSA